MADKRKISTSVFFYSKMQQKVGESGKSKHMSGYLYFCGNLDF